MKDYILVKDMTRLFTKEILLYSFFDLSLKKPLKVSFLLYSIVLFIIWSIPMGIVLWPFNVYKAVLVLIPPFILGKLMSQPIWGGKSFLSWLKCQIKFAISKKKYYDGYFNKDIGKKFIVEHSYSVSRRKDYNKLFNYIEREKLNEK